MAKAYLQGQRQERKPESARPDGPHRYRYPQKQGHQYLHHPVPPTDDVHAPPPPHLRSVRREQHQGGRWQERRRKPVEQ